jgi:CBS domain-containing protein
MFDAEHQMRTTLTIDNDVLDAAKVLARHRNSSLPVLTRDPHGALLDLALVNQLSKRF